MRVDGRWLLCDDHIVRPTIPGEIQASDGSWQKAEFLVDTAADRTVLTAQFLASLGLSLLATSEQIGGVGGTVQSLHSRRHGANGGPPMATAFYCCVLPRSVPVAWGHNPRAGPDFRVTSSNYDLSGLIPQAGEPS